MRTCLVEVVAAVVVVAAAAVPSVNCLVSYRLVEKAKTTIKMTVSVVENALNDGVVVPVCVVAGVGNERVRRVLLEKEKETKGAIEEEEEQGKDIVVVVYEPVFGRWTKCSGVAVFGEMPRDLELLFHQVQHLFSP